MVPLLPDGLDGDDNDTVDEDGWSWSCRLPSSSCRFLVLPVSLIAGTALVGTGSRRLGRGRGEEALVL